MLRHRFYTTGEKSAFSVTHAESGLSTQGTIRFAKAITNIGGHYNTSSGNFTCEYPGVYVFHLHIVKDEKDTYAWCYIRKNGAYMVYIETSGDSDDASAHIGSSNSVILQLAHGDNVDVAGCSSILTLYRATETTFSGFLLTVN